MSYSSQTKEELCRFEPDSVCCLLAELSGIVCAAGSVIYRGGGEKRLSIETENNAVAGITARGNAYIFIFERNQTLCFFFDFRFKREIIQGVRSLMRRKTVKFGRIENFSVTAAV